MRFYTLLLLCSVLITACQGPAPPNPGPTFRPGDFIRCSTGSSENTFDELSLSADGKLHYKPASGQERTRQLTAQETQKLYQELLKAGLLELVNTPNRDVELYGILVEAQLGPREIRATIGVLEMQKKKHRKWQNILNLLVAEIPTDDSL